jgi:hypothetical protein
MATFLGIPLPLPGVRRLPVPAARARHLGLRCAVNDDAFTPTFVNKAEWTTATPDGQPVTGAASCNDLKPGNSCLKPILYALDNALPGTLATGQAALWTANGAQGWYALIPVALAILKDHQLDPRRTPPR